MNITPNIRFNGDCKEALKLYEKAFKGKVTLLLHFCDADPSDMTTQHLSDKEKMYVYHSEMLIGNQRFFFSDDLKETQRGQNVSIAITFDAPDDVKAAYEILVEDGVIIAPLMDTTYSSCFVSLIDKFGMRWELMTENND